jgi:hypothetical protein
MQFYDYTKVPARRPLPPNYHLTFSWSDPRDLDLMMGEASRGLNLAVPFHHPDNRSPQGKNPAVSVLPKSFLGMPVISGDTHDIRPLDRFHPAAQDGPVVVGLRFKEPLVLDMVGEGRRHREAFGAFVIDVYETLDDHGNAILVGSQVPSYTAGTDAIRKSDHLLSSSLDERREAFERQADAARGRLPHPQGRPNR